MKAAIYARVSTRGQSAEMQISELAQYCERRSWGIVERFVDLGISGARDKRPALERMMTAARRAEIDAVVVYRLDRLARSLKHLLFLLEEFQSLGIKFVSLHEGVDTSTPAGKLQFSLLGAFAEFERELIRERIRSGIAAAKAKGTVFGRPHRVFDRRKAARLRRQGLSWRKVEAQMGIPRQTLQRSLKSVPKTVMDSWTA